MSIFDPSVPAKVTKHNYANASLDDWQAAFWSLYGHKDDDLKLHDMMLQLVVDSTRMSEAIRKRSYEEALPCLPRVFNWMCSMGSKCATNRQNFGDLSPNGWSLAEVIWDKYPGLCALCAETKCVCPTWNTDSLRPEERNQIYVERTGELDKARRTGKRPVTLDGWVEMFDAVYGTVNSMRSASTKVLHFWEEVGELEVELRKADRLANKVALSGSKDDDRTISWEPELADVFSWLSSIYLHIDREIGNANRTIAAYHKRLGDHGAAEDMPTLRTLPLSQWIWAEYGDTVSGEGLRCHRCKQAPCLCNVSFSRR